MGPLKGKALAMTAGPERIYLPGPLLIRLYGYVQRILMAGNSTAQPGGTRCAGSVRVDLAQRTSMVEVGETVYTLGCLSLGDELSVSTPRKCTTPLCWARTVMVRLPPPL